MTFAAHFGVVVRVGLILAGRQVGKEQRHIVVELAWIGLERQQIIGVLVYNELGDGGLAADGSEGDQAASQIQRPQQLGNGGDCVRFLGDLALAQHQMIGGGPGADHINGAAAEAFGVRTPQLLTSDGDHLPLEQRARRPDPIHEAGLEVIGGQSPEHAPERVVRWDAVGQIEKRPKPSLLAAAKLGHGDPIIGAGNAGTDRHHQNRRQIVRFRALKPGITQGGKMRCDTDARLRTDKGMQTHGGTSNGR